MGTIDAYAQQTTPTGNPGWNLRWRPSPQLAAPSTPAATIPTASTQPDVFALPPRPTTDANVQAANPMRDEPLNAFQQAVVSRAIRRSQPHPSMPDPLDAKPLASDPQNPVQQVQYQIHAPAGASTAGTPVQHAQPVGNYQRSTNAAAAPTARIAQANDFFNNPFADETPIQRRALPSPGFISTPQVTQDASGGGMQLPDLAAPPTPTPTPNIPEELPANALRGMQLDESIDPDHQILPEPKLSQPDAGSSMRELLNDPSINDPSIQVPQPDPDTSDAVNPSPRRSPDGFRPEQDDPNAASPSDRNSVDPLPPGNPFNDGRGRQDQAAPDSDSSSQTDVRDSRVLMANQLSCEDFRQRIARETIDRISLDPSPPFRPDLFDVEVYQRQREKFEQRQPSRPWSGIDGRVIANGRFVDLAYERVIIESETGERKELPIERLSEGDLGYISENWGLPKECLIEQVAFTPRAWTQQTMTWKASNLCSKPLYFDEVNLERYGHTAGPWLQPIVSSAHFFGSVAVLPYKMGIHPPNECRYALGYYRPGNCAPWIVPPVPISARGALTQGAFMTGAFWMIP